MAVWTVIAKDSLSLPASSVTWSSISSSYDHLKLVVSARTDKSAFYEQAAVTLNGENTGTNYSATQLAGFASTPSSSGFINDAFVKGSYIPAASILADTFGIWEMWIPNYANTVGYKQMLIQFAVPSSSTADYEWMIGMIAGLWAGTPAAVDEITITCDDGTNDFIAFSTFTLYGVKGA